MKNHIKFILSAFLISMMFLQSCKNTEQNKEQTTASNSDEESIFNLTTKWRTEEGKEIELQNLKGKVLVVVMIYTSCRAACPRLVADMKSIEKQIPNDVKNNIMN